MHGLKRVGWMMGQSLLPHHLCALEDSLLTHTFYFRKGLGVYCYGIGSLKWEDNLLRQGIVSIIQMSVVFPSGHFIDTQDNGEVNSIDLNKIGKQRITLYLHLLKDSKQEKGHLNSEEELSFSIYQLLLSPESAVERGQGMIKFAEFEKDMENYWRLSETYIPPLLETFANPFLLPYISHIQTTLKNFQSKLIPELRSGEFQQNYTYKTKFCIKEVAQLKRMLMNMERGAVTHPYFLYESLCQFLDGTMLMYNEQIDLQLIAYQHDELGPLFDLLIKTMLTLLKFKSETLSSLQFELEQKTQYYVIEKLPGELRDAEDIYLIIQPLNSADASLLEGVKLASRSRLPVVIRHALTGIEIIPKEQAPFNNNFSKDAHVYSLKRGSEWNAALNEEKLAFTSLNLQLPLQGFLYWRK